MKVNIKVTADDVIQAFKLYQESDWLPQSCPNFVAIQRALPDVAHVGCAIGKDNEFVYVANFSDGRYAVLGQLADTVGDIFDRTASPPEFFRLADKRGLSLPVEYSIEVM